MPHTNTQKHQNKQTLQEKQTQMAKILQKSSILFFFFLLLLHSSNSQLHPSDFSALREIRNTLTDIPSSTHFFSSWNFSNDPCTSFAGLTCSITSPQRVTILSLGTGLSDSPGLAGTLSPSLAKLTELTQLILFSGIVTGTIPYQLGSLLNLRVISLTNNRLTGSIPGEILRLPNLHTLDLSHNQLTGSIPSSLTGLPQLKVLVLASNALSGRLPRYLPDELFHLDLSYNYFYGRLPHSMPEKIRYVSLSNNRLWGQIGNQFGDAATDLVYLDLSMNRFTGPIPGSLFRPMLKKLLLQRNNLSGWIPRCPTWQYGVGSVVDLSHNFLSGELNEALIGVESLFLNNNKLWGPVPDAYVAGVKQGVIKTLYLQHNYLTYFPMDVGSSLPGDVAVCVSYNCITAPPVGMEGCPISAGDQASRPGSQCFRFHGEKNY